MVAAGLRDCRAPGQAAADQGGRGPGGHLAAQVAARAARTERATVPSVLPDRPFTCGRVEAVCHLAARDRGQHGGGLGLFPAGPAARAEHRDPRRDHGRAVAQGIPPGPDQPPRAAAGGRAGSSPPASRPPRPVAASRAAVSEVTPT